MFSLFILFFKDFEKAMFKYSPIHIFLLSNESQLIKNTLLLKSHPSSDKFNFLCAFLLIKY